MIAAEIAEVIRIALSGHPLLTDVLPTPATSHDRAVLYLADTDALLWTIAIYPRGEWPA